MSQSIGLALFLVALIGSFIYFVIIRGDEVTCPNCGQRKTKKLHTETLNIDSSNQGIFDMKVTVKERVAFRCRICHHDWEQEMVS